VRSCNTYLLLIIVLLLGLVLLQTRSYTHMLDRYRVLKDQQHLAAAAGTETAELSARVEALKHEVAAARQEAETCDKRSREREDVNQRLREQLQRSATTIRELTATVEALRKSES